MIFGKPGSGKSTQAYFFVDKFGLNHFDTGKEIEKTVHDPVLANDPVIRREREIFDLGLLNSDDWVIGIFERSIQKNASEGRGMIFSGSPRRLKEGVRVLAALEKAYGRNNIYAFVLDVDDDTAIYRNIRRRICKNCSRSVVWKPETVNLKECLECSGSLFKRPLDTEEIMRKRLQEYANETMPAIDFIKKSGVKFFNVDGGKEPNEVFVKLSSLV